jgi:hypothetical protein
MTRGVFKDLTNMKFGRLKVIERDYSVKNTISECCWLCKCNCGSEKIISVRGSDLKRGKTSSCGCYRDEIRQKGKINTYDLSGEYGIGYTLKGEPFYFDIEDYDKIKNYCWYMSNEGYIVNSGKGKNPKFTRMHTFIMNTPKGMITDHIFGNKNDNRKSKLRIVNTTQNTINRKISKHNKTGIPGVCWHKYSNRWYASITVNKKQIYLGRFIEFDEAIKVRKEAEQKYFGEYAPKIEQI